MRFRLKIDSDNDAMRTRMDVVRALRQLADKLEALGPSRGGLDGNVRDANGNTVGEWKLTYDQKPWGEG